MTNKFKRIIKIIVIIIFAGTIIGFGLWKTKDLIGGINFTVEGIRDGTTYATDTLEIIGIAKNAKLVTLNGVKIFLDKDGNFNETITLLSGYNIITAEATDKFGIVSKKIYKVIFKK